MCNLGLPMELEPFQYFLSRGRMDKSAQNQMDVAWTWVWSREQAGCLIGTRGYWGMETFQPLEEATHLLGTIPVVPNQHHTITITAREERVHRRPPRVAASMSMGGGAAVGPRGACACN